MLYSKRATAGLKRRPRCTADCREPAIVDAKTSYGWWGYFCQEHFVSLCPGQLGLGIGQFLLCKDDKDAKLIRILEETKDRPEEPINFTF